MLSPDEGGAKHPLEVRTIAAGTHAPKHAHSKLVRALYHWRADLKGVLRPD